jgi:hypothetical protein
MLYGMNGSKWKPETYGVMEVMPIFDEMMQADECS